MPLYEYQCEACGHKFELIRKFSDPPVETCPSCGSGTVQKLQSASAFQLKGTGWYLTDYARKGARAGQTPPAKINGASSGEPGTPREAADKNPSAVNSSLQPTPASSSAPAAPAAPASEKSS
jgi:putative FmdB family regulatory protein